MYIVGNFLLAVAKVLDIALSLYMWIIVARAVLSWVNPDPYNAIVRFISTVTEPVLFQIRSRIPVTFSGIDFSPIVVFLGIVFLKSFLVTTLIRLSTGLIM
jgi:YggT family protein